MPLSNIELSQLWNYRRRIQNESAFPTLVYRLIEQLPGRYTGRLQSDFNTLLRRWRNQPTRANSDNLFNWIHKFRNHTPLYDHFYDYMMAPTIERRNVLANIPRADEETEIENNSAESDDTNSTISQDQGDIGDIASGGEEDEPNGGKRNPYALLEQKGHEGKFTAQFKARKPHLRHLKTLGEFAHYILTHPTEFNKISKQRANYYRNLIERKGGMMNPRDIRNSYMSEETFLNRREELKKKMIYYRSLTEDLLNDVENNPLFENPREVFLPDLIELLNKIIRYINEFNTTYSIERTAFHEYELVLRVLEKRTNEVKREVDNMKAQISHFEQFEFARQNPDESFNNQVDKVDEIPEQEEAVQLGEGRN